MKRLSVFLFVFSFICLFNVNIALADKVTRFDHLPDVSGFDESLMYHYHYDGVDYYRAIFFNGDSVYYDTVSGGEIYLPSSYDRYNYDSSSHDWVLLDTNNASTITSWDNYDCEILYSTVDVFYKYSNELFFAATPMSTTFYSGLSGGQIATIILKQMAFLIPCLIGLVIGLIALKKAWSWLKIQLAQ